VIENGSKSLLDLTSRSAVLCAFSSRYFSLKSSKRAIPEMKLLTFSPISYRINLLWSIVMEIAIMFLRLPIISYQAHMRIPQSVRPPPLLLLILQILVTPILLYIILVILAPVTPLMMGISFLLLILLHPGTLTAVFLRIRMSVTQFLAELTRSYLPSPIQTLCRFQYPRPKAGNSRECLCR